MIFNNCVFILNIIRNQDKSRALTHCHICLFSSATHQDRGDGMKLGLFSKTATNTADGTIHVPAKN